MTTKAQRKRILKRLAEVWERNPEMRFCQLIHHLGRDVGCCIFHVSDKDFEWSVERMMKEL